MLSSSHARRPLILLSAALLLCVGCIDDDPVTPAPAPEPPVVAATADEAISYFRDAYSGRDLEFYEQLLSEGFLFIKKDDAADDVAAELAIAGKMFSGVAGQNNYIIGDINIDVLDPQGVWLPTPEDDPDFGGFSGSQFRMYDVFVQFAISGENLTLLVRGSVIFYVMDEGADTSDFRVLGVRDLTFDKVRGTEATSWTAVRSLFE